MRKFVAIAFALVLTVATLAGCGAKPTEAPAPTQTLSGNAPETPTEVKEPSVSTTFWTDSQQLEEGLRAAVEAFSAEHPSYTISVEAFPGSERPEKLAFAKESNTLPSLFLTAFFTSADEVHQGAILPVTDVVEESFADQISDATLSTVSIHGDYYQIPIYTSSQGLLYNADMFKAAGLEAYVPEDPNEIACWTLADFDQVILPALKEYLSGSEKYVMTLYAANSQNDSYLHNLLKIYDGNIFTDGYCTAGDDENVIKALDKLKQWHSEGYTNADVNTRLWTDCNADFRNQSCAISAGQFASYKNHIAAFESGNAERFDVRIATVPCEKADGTNTGVMHTYTYGFSLMNVDEQQALVAKQFLAWLSENALAYIPAMISGVPAMENVAQSMSGENPLFLSYKDAEKYLFDFTGGAPGWVATRNVFYPEIQAAISGEKTSAQALADYETAANEIITEYAENSAVLNR